jgi:LysR family hydrogen peroxide-inducible transcriptional activator
VLASARDLSDFARHSGRVLSGRLRLGVIPTLAPYMLPQILPALQQRFPQARVELRETQTRNLTDELARGALDAVLLALPLEESDFETQVLFDDPFLLAVPAAEARAARVMIEQRSIDPRRLILLEEGHCLRDQALAFCGARIETASSLGTSGLGATSLSTVMQMVANGYGVTLLPRIALPVEARDARVKVLRFRAPAPARQIGLAWRRTSPRKADFAALATIVREQFAA